MRTKSIIIWSAVLILAVIAAIIAWIQIKTPIASAPTEKQLTNHFIASALFSCDNEKTINAAFYAGESIPSTDPNIPPIPGGNVDLILSDGRNMTLPHVISADGGHYANADESFIFWNRGDTAFITENNIQTYTNCITSPN